MINRKSILIAFLGLVALTGWHYALPGHSGDSEGTEELAGAIVARNDQIEANPVTSESIDGTTPISKTEIAGGDTCTVLPQKIELVGGALCEVLDETPFVIGDEPANYRCSDGTWLIGAPDKTEAVWTINQVAASREGDPLEVGIGKAWR